MRDFRLVIVSTEPQSDFWFVEYVEGINLHEAIEQANKTYAPHFEVDAYKSGEIGQCTV